MLLNFPHYLCIFLFTTIISAQEYEKINGAWNAIFFDYGLGGNSPKAPDIPRLAIPCSPPAKAFTPDALACD